jgi:hypothetical protein
VYSQVERDGRLKKEGCLESLKTSSFYWGVDTGSNHSWETVMCHELLPHAWALDDHTRAFHFP